METRVIYCSVCDREVEVVLKPGTETAAAVPDLEGSACLDIGARCTGSMCPICATSPAEIRQRLEQIAPKRAPA